MPSEKTDGADVVTDEQKRRRDKWAHEDHLINHRLTWLLGTQTLLLGGYGLLNQRLTDWFYCPTKPQNEHILYLLSIIPEIGFWLSAALGLGLAAALAAMIILKYQGRRESESVDVSIFTTVGGWVTGIALPIVFCVAWDHVGANQNEMKLRQVTGQVAEQVDDKVGDRFSCHPFVLERWRLGQPAPAPSQTCPPACAQSTVDTKAEARKTKAEKE